MKEFYEKTPFRNVLTEFSNTLRSPLYTNLTVLSEDYLVRIEGIDNFDFSPRSIKTGRKLIEKIDNEYGIAVPRFDIIFAPFPERDFAAVYYVVAKVDGKNLIDSRVSPKEAEEFYSALIKYHEDVYVDKGYFLSDLGIWQFMYGRTKGDDHNRIYLVDIDPFYNVFDREKESSRSFFDNLENLVSALNKSEMICGARFPHLAKRVRVLLEKIWREVDIKKKMHVNEIIKSLITEEMASDLSENRFGRFQNEHGHL